MSSLIYGTSGQATMGQMTAAAIAKIVATNAAMARITEAIATASSGFEGTPGTQFEANDGGFGTADNLFQALPSDTAGEQGSNYRFAVESLNAQWQTFMDAAKDFIAQLDQGQQVI